VGDEPRTILHGEEDMLSVWCTRVQIGCGMGPTFMVRDGVDMVAMKGHGGCSDQTLG